MAQIDKHWYQQWWGIGILLFAALILALFLAFAFFVYQSIRDFKAAPVSFQPKPMSEAERLLVEGPAGHSFGANDPALTIVEFGDYACPYCQRSFSAIRHISLKHSDRIKFIFRDFPSVADHSLLLALAANCAGDQGLYWPMHDKLFIHFGISERTELIRLARQIGADEAVFTACLDSEKHLNRIRKNLSDAETLGVEGTPTWFINGHRLSGHVPPQVFIETIEMILNNQ